QEIILPHHKSCIKRIRTSTKARVSNRSARSRLHTMEKKVLDEAKTLDERKKLADDYFSFVDKLARKNVIKKNKASNTKSKVMRRFNTTGKNS
ncbi:MAG: 30S ribosomal protein S20, partial [Fibrobacterota bacterium]